MVLKVLNLSGTRQSVGIVFCIISYCLPFFRLFYEHSFKLMILLSLNSYTLWRDKN